MKKFTGSYTRNPLVALYFSIKGNPNKMGYVYGIHPIEVVNIGSYNESNYNTELFTGSSISFYEPSYSNERAAAQSGFFSIHYFDNKKDRATIINRQLSNLSIYPDAHIFKIGAKNKRCILNELSTLNIKRNSIYPGIQGVCEDIRDEWILE